MQFAKNVKTQVLGLHRSLAGAFSTNLLKPQTLLLSNKKFFSV
jgi:hypothetical protein